MYLRILFSYADIPLVKISPINTKHKVQTTAVGQQLTYLNIRQQVRHLRLETALSTPETVREGILACITATQTKLRN